MNRRNLLTALALAATVGLGAAFTSQDTKTAKLGEEVPNFTLTDVNGKDVNLKDVGKDKIVVLQWVNPGCPVCKRVHESGLVGDMLKKIKEMDDVVHIAVNSTYGANATSEKAALKKYGVEYTLVLDTDGSVGKMFGAKTTPHMFVIDKKGVLRYDGAFDDDASGRKDEKTNYALNAIAQIKAGETVSPDQTRPYGCSVKYKG